jgi:hypothetical protein
MTDDELDCSPCLKPPFSVLEYGDHACILDMEGRTFFLDHRAKEFVKELCKVLNENKERLVEAWKRSRKTTSRKRHGR